MYTQFFRLTQAPFSISPDPRYLFMSERHREALAHLLYGIESGGVVVLTGEIGTGKTTICRCFLEQVPATCNVAYIFNPKLSVGELLQSICEEFRIPLPDDEQRMRGAKAYIDALNRFLLEAHAQGRSSVLIIDEAQNLSPEVLEQLRLLTNLETSERKLLQIILIGQPELRAMLARPELEQLAQRVTAYYHLTALSEQETAAYIQHRLTAAGLTTASPFQPAQVKRIHHLSAGVPRRINLLCDRALLGGYAKGSLTVDRDIIETAATELFVNRAVQKQPSRRLWADIALGVVAVLAAAISTAWTLDDGRLTKAAGDGWRQAARAMHDGMDKAVRLAAFSPGGDMPEPAVMTPVRDPASAPTPAPAAPAPAAAPIAPAPLPSLPAAVTPAPAMDTEAAAVRQLATLWGVTLSGDQPCEAAQQSGLRCYQGEGGFAELQALGRPAALRLQDDNRQPYYVLLTGLGDRSATIHKGEAVETVTRLALARRFGGEFITLWRTPPKFAATVRPADSGLAADWVARQMARLNGVTSPPAGQPLGEATVQQVRQFQRAHGLLVDGVVGPLTAMHINRVAGVPEPRLQEALAMMNPSLSSGN